VWFIAPQTLNDETIETWIRKMKEASAGKFDEAVAAVVRRLWADNRVIQPALWGIDLARLRDTGEGRWTPWSEFIGDNDERPREGSS
jgi:hypothetical protein